MADINVDYGSIQVNFNTLIQKLNGVAIDFAEKKNPNIKVENLAFSDSDDPKQAKFLGGGQYRIAAGMKDKTAKTLPKNDFYDVLVEYTTWFCGKEEASYIKLDHLDPIMRSEDLSSKTEQVSSDTDSGSQTSGDNEISSDTGNEDTSSQISSLSESYVKRSENNLLDLLFESEDKNDDVENEENNDEDDSGEDKVNQSVIGYSISYDISVNGKKSNTVKDAIHQKSRGLFGGVLADLRNIKFIIGGKSYNIGKWTDPAKLKELVGIIDIDKNRVADNVKNALNHDFNNNDAQVRVMGNNNTNNGLETHLNRNGKMTPEIKTKLGQAEYSVVVSVNQNDVNYPNYNQKTIAKSASKGFGTGDKTVDSNQVGEKDVIKIDDINNLYKSKSEYDQTSNLDVRDRESNGKSNTSRSTNTTTPQTTKTKNTPTTSSVTEKENQNKSDTDENKVKEDTELEKLVKSDNYKNFVNSTLQEQCKLEITEDEYTCAYKSTEDITNDMMQKGVNDLDLLRKMKNGGKQSYYITITKNIEQTVNEEIRDTSHLIDLLFENIDETEEVLEEGDESKKIQALDQAVDSINLTGDEKQDQISRKKIKTGVHNVLKKDKIELQVKNIAERIIKNTIIKTLDKFKTGRNFDDFDTDCFITSVIKQDVQESLQDFIRDYLNRLDESNFNESDNGTRNEGDIPDKIKLMNSDLIGKITDIVDKGTPGWHVDPYCAITSSVRVIEYMKKHNIGDQTIYSEIQKKPYCAIVLAKRDMELEDRTISGGSGNKTLTDSRVNQVLDLVCGADNKLNVINCKNQNRDTMDNVNGDLISRTLAFYSEKNSKSENFVRNPGERHVPELDVWVRPFDLTDDTPDPTPTDLKVTIIWFIVLPDPVPVIPTDDKTKKKSAKAVSNVKVDWYIIPHKRIKDLGDRPHQETHYSDGVTATKTSNDEYKP